MRATIRQHTGAILVAGVIVAASLLDGAFDPTAYAAASVVIWIAVIAGLVGRGLPTAPVAVTAALAGLFLGAATVLAGASIAWASDQGRAFDEAVRASAYLGLFTLAACTASRPGRGQWLGGLAAGLGAVSVLALLSYLQPGLLDGGDLGRLIPGAAGRLSYPIGYWNGLAALLAVGVVLLLHGGVHAPLRWMRSAAVAAAPLALASIWLTSSRGGAVAALAGIAALLAASPDRVRQLLATGIAAVGGAVLIGAAEQMDALTHATVDSARREDGDVLSAMALVVAGMCAAAAWVWDGRRPTLAISRRLAVGAIGLVGLGLVAGAVLADPAERFREFKEPPAGLAGRSPVPDEDLNSSGRWQFWTEAVDAFESAPAAGIGAGAFEDWWAQNATIPVFVRNPHSLPLQQAAELGLLGAVLLLGFVVAVCFAGWRRLAAGRDRDGGALVAVLTAAGLCAAIDWSWEIPAAFAPAMIAAGLLTAYAPGHSLKRNAYWLGAGTVVAAWVAIIAAGLVVLTELRLEQSREAAARGEVEDAVDDALAARTVQPWSPEPYTQLALLEELRGDFDQALVRLHQARERDSEDWRLALIEARLQQGRGDELAAREALERARVLNPSSPIVNGRG